MQASVSNALYLILRDRIVNNADIIATLTICRTAVIACAKLYESDKLFASHLRRKAGLSLQDATFWLAPMNNLNIVYDTEIHKLLL